MSVRIYLLSLREISGPEQTEVFIRQAFLLVDKVRREKAEKIQKPGAQAVSLGAGLLLQKMVLDYRNGAADCEKQECEEQEREEQVCKEQTCEEQICIAQDCEVLQYEARELMELLKTGQQNVSEGVHNSESIPLPLQYRFGPHGKPEIVDFPLRFSLSHSGDYVLCAVSDREVGADIQKLQTADFSKLASRFFTEAEYQVLDECDSEAERQKLFFRLWTKKEAYGKLTGQGIMAALNREVLYSQWPDIPAPEGYAVAVCTEREVARNLDSEDIKY